jgi:hypothetical protein
MAQMAEERIPRLKKLMSLLSTPPEPFCPNCGKARRVTPRTQFDGWTGRSVVIYYSVECSMNPTFCPSEVTYRIPGWAKS